jgi:hypothetical protein
MARRVPPPAAVPRPWLHETRTVVVGRLEDALAARAGAAAAVCVHELWMRGEIGLNIERALERLWAAAAAAVPEWLPTRHVEWLPLAYEVAARCVASRRGRSSVYLVLLDFSDTAGDPHGLYVGATAADPVLRFEQHMAGIRSSGSVRRRGLELLPGPTLHLRGIASAEAARIETQLAEALSAAGIRVRGGH